MSPEERQLIAGLFERIKAAATGPRDQEAESFINEQVKAQPAAPYLLAQTVIVQEEALKGANARIEELERQVRDLETKPAGGGFLGGLFGGQRSTPQPRPLPGAAPGGMGAGGMGAGGMGAAPGGPWGNPAPQGYAPPQGYAAPQAGMESGGFLRGALGTAAGVAGGVLLADSIRSLFSHGSGYGGMANLGIGSGFTPTSETTVINNYYGDEGAGGQGYDAGYEGDPGGDGGGPQDADYNAGYDDGGFDSGGDGGFDV